MRSHPLLSRLALSAAAAVLATACGPMAAESGAMDHDMGGMHGDAGGEAPATVEGADEVTVTATDLAFDVSTIDATAGEPVNITLANDGETFHDLHVDAADFMLDADPGATVSGALTIDEPGTYTFRCTVQGHASAGMQGSITVGG